MIRDINLINMTINNLQAGNRADLIKSALNKNVNFKQLEKDFEAKQEASKKRFQQAKEKFEQEQRIFQESEKSNSLIVLEKNIKQINQKLENLGF